MKKGRGDDFLEGLADALKTFKTGKTPFSALMFQTGSLPSQALTKFLSSIDNH